MVHGNFMNTEDLSHYEKLDAESLKSIIWGLAAAGEEADLERLRWAIIAYSRKQENNREIVEKAVEFLQDRMKAAAEEHGLVLLPQSARAEVRDIIDTYLDILNSKKGAVISFFD